VRRVEQDGAVLVGDTGRVFTFREDDTVMCTLRATHFDEEVYADAHKFIPGRFMADGRRTKNGKDLPNFWMAFGGGSSIVRDSVLVLFYRRSVRRLT
jgi:cytochrome P450